MPQLPTLTRAAVTLAIAVTPLSAAEPAPAPVQDAAPPPSAAAADAGGLPTMPIEQVRVGMKGYGLTVFHGTKIEPFAVEVVSVVPDSSPKHGTIWIRCFDPRLELSGPVQGMSGSPIFLWDEGQAGTIGDGGRLIGAFAFGYSMVKECLAGVQPIAYMRRVGERSYEEIGNGAQAGSPAAGTQMLARMQRLAGDRGASARDRFRLDAITQLMQRVNRGAASDAAAAGPTALPRDPFGDGGVQRLMVPLSVGSASTASLMAPLLEPLGLTPVAGSSGGNLAGDPPFGIEPEQVRLEPGSVLAIPLAYGDMDLSATGTVTDVLADGTVLGFGHAMFGQGDVALPMATGYVHFFVPRITTSFKQSGSLRLQGSITQDEAVAVAGIRQQRYEVAPVDVTVAMPGQADESYHYEVVNHPQMTPQIAAIVAMQSITAAQELPTESTLGLTGEMTFTGGRKLSLDTLLAPGDAMGLVFEIMPAIAALMNNQHENLKLESVNLSTRIEPVLRVGSIVNARLERAEVAPGEKVRLTVTVQPYGKAEQTFNTELTVPATLVEGDYQLMLLDGASYAAMSMANRPHLMTTASVDDLLEMVQEILSVKREAMYAVIQLPQQGIAVGRSELPQLPSSRRAIIATPTSTLAVPYVETVESRIDTGMVVDGQLAFTVNVREKTPPPAAATPRPSQPPRRP